MIKTIKLKDLLKYLVGLISIILICVCSTRYFCNLNNSGLEFLLNLDYASIIKSNIAIACIEETNIINKKDGQYTTRSGATRILAMELPNIEKEELKENDEGKIELGENNKEAEEEWEEPKREQGELNETYTNKYGSVKIKNDTNIKLTESILKPDYTPKNCKDLIIYHTHTCESYTQTKENTYKASGNFRTTDLEHSVVRVGEELENCLKKYKFNE